MRTWYDIFFCLYVILLTNKNEKHWEMIRWIKGLKSQCLNLQMNRKFNKIFSGWQQRQGVKILNRFRDWLRPNLEGATDGSAEPKLSARERCIEFCRR